PKSRECAGFSTSSWSCLPSSGLRARAGSTCARNRVVLDFPEDKYSDVAFSLARVLHAIVDAAESGKTQVVINCHAFMCNAQKLIFTCAPPVEQDIAVNRCRNRDRACSPFCILQRGIAAPLRLTPGGSRASGIGGPGIDFPFTL